MTPPILTLTQTVAPAQEPITLEEARQHLLIDSDEHDAMIASYIASARAAAESYLNRQLITATYTATLADFPVYRGIIELPRPPIQSITSVVYLDQQGDSTTLGAANYGLVTGNVSGHILPAKGYQWPIVYDHDGAENVTVTFKAGYGETPSTVPDEIKAAIRLMVEDLFHNRAAQQEGNLTPNRTASMLLDLRRVVPV